MKAIPSLLTIVLIAAACNNSPKTTPVANPASQNIDAYISEVATRLNLPGITVAATRNDSIVYQHAFGYRNIDTKEPMKVAYDFHWASVSKTFVATAIMQLVEQGKINLDEKLITYLPYFKLADPNYKNITIRQMLNHTCGIGDVSDYEWDKPQFDEGAPEKYVRGMANDKMRFAPGTDWAYSNNAFEILGVVITTVSGMPFETYIKKNIFVPLEMTTTSFIYPEIPDSLRVTGHTWAGKPLVSKVYPYNRIHAPSSTLNTNVLDMTHYAMANLHRGEYKGKRILSEDSYHVLWTNSVNLPDTNKSKVGASWFLGTRKGLRTVTHSGGDTGFNSYLLLLPDKNISVEVVSNYDQSVARGIGYAVADFLTGKTPDVITWPIGLAYTEVLLKDGPEKAKAFYNSTNSDSVKRKYFSWGDEAGFTWAGYMLQEADLWNNAVDVYKFAIEANPDSPYVTAYLGIAYSKLGNKDLARENLNRAIEMAPKEEFFKEELKKLGK
jgi:CubicO group peptidase (beta-lactamase class C family)